ncbi:MAG: TRAP transporter large permease [Myxococcales bacterium]|nr:TRAP transporter large permease [Myxococcales bacterium]MCB9583062.1 TRAP transporter large permease [Polyangiaceae bacterium]
MIILIFVLVFALIGAPVFAVMAGATELAWLLHPDQAMHHVRFLAPDVLDERFAGSPILVTVPLFTFIGYTMAESKTPERIVRASNAFFGWMPGGLAIVCIFASAFFTTLTGGSAVTIVAIGALLYPALLKRGYPQDYALGLVMTGGSLGLLLPPSLPILVYSLVAGIDFTKAFKAGILPGLLIIALLGAHAAYVGVKAKIPRTAPKLAEMGSSVWYIKWELGIPVLILGGLATGLTDIDESAAFAAAYVLLIEIYIYKDLTWKDFPRIAKNAIALAGAVLLIMAMAMALTNYIISEQIPQKLFEWVTSMGVKERWQFLITLNVFLYIQGMVMDGFSAILVAVPLLIPFAAQFGLSPFHLAMMFLLNLEIAYLSPPLGQNLFVTSFRFNRPMLQLYRIAPPFIGILLVGLVLLMTIPKLSTIAVEGDIAAARAKAEKYGEPPREAWLMECVQEDRNNPLPCSEADKKKWGAGATIDQAGTAPDVPEDDTGSDDDLLDKMMGEGGAGGEQKGSGDTDDDLLDKMMGEGGAGGSADEPKKEEEPKEKSKDGTDDDLLDKMLDE